MNTIDTELTHAYLREVQRQIETANETIRQLQEQATPKWHSVKEHTPDGLYIIKTDKGTRYLQQLINGKWMSDVRYWMPLPE